MDESPNQSNALEGESPNQSTDDLNRLMANLGFLSRRIEDTAARIADESLAAVRGMRRRLEASEAIDLSNLDRPATNRAPDAGIDLCSPNCVQSQKEQPYKCPVCLESVRMREPVSTTCGHVFCKDCLIAAIRSFAKCPMCNKKITEGQFSRIYL